MKASIIRNTALVRSVLMFVKRISWSVRACCLCSHRLRPKKLYASVPPAPDRGYLEQKLTIEVQLHHPPSPRDIFFKN